MYLSIAFLASCRPHLCETTYGKDVGDMFFFFLKRLFDILRWEDDSMSMSSISIIKTNLLRTFIYCEAQCTCYWSPLPHFCLYSNADILMNDVRTNACIICYVCVYTWPRKAQTCPDKTKDCISKNEKQTILGSTVLCPFDSELRSWWQGPCQVQLRAPLLMNSSTW